MPLIDQTTMISHELRYAWARPKRESHLVEHGRFEIGRDAQYV